MVLIKQKQVTRSFLSSSRSLQDHSECCITDFDPELCANFDCSEFQGENADGTIHLEQKDFVF